MPETGKALPKTILEHKDNWFWRTAWRRMHTKHQQFNAAVVGEPGSGKSYFAMAAAELLDRDSADVCRFDVSRIAFTAQQFFDLANQKLPVGSAIILDDSAIAAYSADALKKSVKEIAKCFISMRHLRRAVFLTFPSLNMLASNIVRCLQHYVELKNIDYEHEQSVAKVLKLQLSPRSGKCYFHSFKFKINSYRSDIGMTMPQKFMRPLLRCSLPSPKLVVDYEAERAKVMQKLYKQSQTIVSDKKETRRSFKQDYEFVQANRKRFENGKGRVSVAKLLIEGLSENRALIIARELKKEGRK